MTFNEGKCFWVSNRELIKNHLKMDLMTTIVKLLESVLLNSYTFDKDEPEVSNYTCDTSMTIDQFVNLTSGEYLACLEFVYGRL